MNKNKSDFNLIANMISRKIGVIAQAKKGGCWSCNVDKKIIWYPDTIKYSDTDLGYLFHEAAHLRFSDSFIITSEIFTEICSKLGKVSEQIWSLINAFEDVRVEKLLSKEYPGVAEYFTAISKSSFDSMSSNLSSMKIFYPEIFNNKKKHLWSHYCTYIIFYMSGEIDKATAILNVFDRPKKLIKVIKKTSKYIDKSIECNSTVELIEYLKKYIFPQYCLLCDDEKLVNKMKKKELENIINEILKIVLQAAKKQHAKGEVELSKEDRETVPSMTADRTERSEITQYRKSKPKKDTIDKIYDERDITTEEIANTVNQHLSSVRKAVSILKDSAIERFEGNYESGKLQNRKLYKIRVKNTKIFTRKIATQSSDKDMCFAILVDESGSMRDSQSKAACFSVSLISKALELSGKSHAIIGFNCRMYCHKNFGEKLLFKKMTDIVNNTKQLAAKYNDDGWAVKETADMLKKQPQSKKILIVLSDGHPEESELHEHYDLTIEAKKAEKEVTVYSIGINTDAVKRYYKNYKVISDVSQLGTELANIFKETAGKRQR